uniref:collagen alpha-1(II) chain-like isoform X2 n=1 Tax=Oncorhynchus gorbuscha TaxID=8017 RepID=UPI001EAECBCB|nr:collagen alpha-1(II) chain-like isoform X2 [Oncorhynchus gorbuscha]
MYLSDKPNYLLIQTLLDLLHQELHLLIDPPDGTKEHPATTCLELWISQPNFTNGMYYIDPNQGSPADALLVYCDFTAAPKTCLSPLQPQVPVKAWLKDSGTNNSFHWLSSKEKGFQFEYLGPDVVQMRFLRLNSRLTSQNITYSCQHGNIQGPGEREPSQELHSRGRREAVFQFESEDLDLLPLRDLAVFGSSDLTQEFGFTVGPVCFS